MTSFSLNCLPFSPLPPMRYGGRGGEGSSETERERERRERESHPKWWTGLLTRAGKGDCPSSWPRAKQSKERGGSIQPIGSTGGHASVEGLRTLP